MSFPEDILCTHEGLIIRLLRVEDFGNGLLDLLRDVEYTRDATEENLRNIFIERSENCDGYIHIVALDEQVGKVVGVGSLL